MTRSKSGDAKSPRYDVKLWDLTGRLVACLYEGEQLPSLPTYTADGTQVLVEIDKKELAWDAATGRPTNTDAQPPLRRG